RTRRRAFEVHSFAVVSATVARALEFVFARLPIRRAAQMRTPRVNHKQPIRRSINPDAIFLLELGVHPERKLRRVSNLENAVRLKKSTWKEKPEKREEPCHKESGDHGPDKAAAMAVNFGGGSGPSHTTSGGSLRCSDCGRAYILRRVHRRFRCGFSRLRIRIGLGGLQLRHESLLFLPLTATLALVSGGRCVLRRR